MRMHEEPHGVSQNTPGTGTEAGKESRFKIPQQLKGMALPCQAPTTLNVIQTHWVRLLLFQALVAAGELFALG